MRNPKHYIELVRGRSLRWHYRIKSANGQILSSSQRYYSRSNCLRAANKLSHFLGIPVKVK